MGQVGRQLAIIGDDINRRYDAEFQTMLEQLQPTSENAYEYFVKIAKRCPGLGGLTGARFSVCSHRALGATCLLSVPWQPCLSPLGDPRHLDSHA